MIRKRPSNALKLLLLLFLFPCFFTFTSFYEPRRVFAAACEDWLAKVVSVQGSVQARRIGESRWIEAGLDDLLCPGDMIRVQENSRAALLLRNESIVRLDQKSALTLPGIESEKSIDVNLLSGAALFFSRFPFSLRVFTPFVNAHIEGTEFLVQLSANKTFLSVYEGKVNAVNESGSLVLQRGQSGSATSGQAPSMRVVARPRDAVSWALYYPPIPYRDIEKLIPTSEAWSAAWMASVEAYRRRDLTGAFHLLKEVETDGGSAVFYAYRALLHLTVGRVAEAESDLRTALAIDPEYSYVPALQSVIATVRNQKDAALDLAKRAIALDGSSTAALIALSYAQQARMDLDNALASVGRAAELDETCGFARARLAELWLMKGYLDKALESAREVVAIDPEVARAQTVLGYAFLARIRIGESKKAFRKAIELDQVDPLSRLGMGLALIRDGDLKAGRTQIEIAAMLDPNNSLIRSYLGKAYYEEKQDAKAARELATAKELDPLDPTPWLYDAIRKQTINRPVEALEDMRKSMELNDNRAVYRSRLLLDQDLAVRSANLGRIYSDLGFGQAALVQGWSALNIAPSNFTAHRFLSDAYSALPRHEAARVSELLQSQLLQPINLNPVQPHLAEPRLHIVQGTGPADASFNEYNSLFNRDRLALLGSALIGERGNLGGEIVQSGVIGRASYSIGHFHYQDNGFRQNNDIDEDIYNTFVQFSLTPNTSVQAEYRNTNVSMGDRDIRSDLENFSPERRSKNQLESVRIGFHHSFSPHSDVIGSYIHSKEDREFRDGVNTFFPIPFSFRISSPTQNTGDLGEIQHLFRTGRFRLVTGGGYLDMVSRNVTETETTLPFIPPIIARTSSKTNITSGNIYLYSQTDLPADLTVTVGGAADFFDDGTEKRDLFSPKLGLTWTPIESTVFRAAGFRRFQRPLMTGQTIEPTQVSGFNQLFDDQRGVGTDTWREGVGVDHKFSEKIFGGLELSRRDIEVPFLNNNLPETADWEEAMVRSYFYWVFNTRFTGSVEFQYEKLERAKLAPEHYEEITTFRIPFGISFFHPSGFFARLRPSYVHQEGRFRAVTGSLFLPDSDSFVSVDASVGVLLPGRWGAVTLEARNLFDQSYSFQDTDPANPSISPRRLLALKYTFSF